MANGKWQEWDTRGHRDLTSSSHLPFAICLLPFAICLFVATANCQLPGVQQTAPLKHLPDKEADDHYRRGVQDIEERHWEAAIRELRLALKLEPKSAAAHNSLGWVLMQTGQYDDALQEFHKATALDPNLAEA